VTTSPPAVEASSVLWPLARRDELAHALARAAHIGRPAAPVWFRLRHEDLAHTDHAHRGHAHRGHAHRDHAFNGPLARSAPAFFRVDAEAGGPEGGGLVAVVARVPEGLRVLAPDGQTTILPVEQLARLLRAGAEAPVLAGVERVLARAQLPAARVPQLRGALVGAALAGEPVAEGWRVRAATGSIVAALREAGVPRRLASTGLAYAVQLALLVVAWWMVGAPAAGGRGGLAGPSPAGPSPAGPSSVLAWVAVLGAFVVAHFTASWAAGRLAVDVGSLLRSRLMDGLLALDAEPLRAEGVGQLLGRVMETEAVESLALGGGLLAMAGLFELTTGAVILLLGARGPVQLGLLALALAGAVVLGARYWRALARWSVLRIELTHDLVERMVGHRTLVAQQPPELRHGDQDRALEAYEQAARGLDRSAAALAVLVPRGWLLLGVIALAPVLAAVPAGAAGLVATSLGGVLFVYTALRKLTQAFPSLATAALAWRQVAPLFAGADAAAAVAAASVSASRSVSASVLASPSVSASASASVPASPNVAGTGSVIVEARGLGFRYPGRAAPALADCSLEIRRGDRILLEGPSGGGKSTLATLIAGLREPDAGVLALDAVDQRVLGLPRWRERVGVVPQFHENHVFSASLLFNLLLGRRWPPRREDVVEAEALCRELDLGSMLARMPSGIEQLVGESGWQLSHGERSRLFIARALLQKLDVRVLDESFAALDPETLERVLGCVLARAETLVVIAHP
jgi:ATP-binding cassette subfamily B protein